MPPPSVVVIDDDPDMGNLVKEVATANGVSCVITSDAASFRAALTDETQLVFLDLLMPEVDGIEILRGLAQQKCGAGIVLMSGVGKRVIETAVELGHNLGLNVVGHLQKPFRIVEVEEMMMGQLEPLVVKMPEGEDGPPEYESSELIGAVERDEFVMHYQPQIDIATGAVVGIEGLVRWAHPEKGMIYPNYFIEQLEELGLIDELGWLVFTHAFSEVGVVNAACGRPLRLSLNVSVHSLRDLEFPDKFVKLAAEHGVLPENVILEITESGLLHELSRTLDVLTRLRMKGVHLSIDDFWTGYSMIQQLRHIPATEMKIDKSLVQGVRNESHRVMVEKTIELGHELEMFVVAEGVETHSQLRFLRERGCDVAQGFLFSTPHAVEKLVVWLQEYGR